jgi:hypothetical protein
VHLSALDAAHLADGAFELALEGAPVVDLLREVGHRVGGLVEQLHPRAPGVGHPPFLRDGDARAGEIARHDHDVAPAAPELVHDPRLGQRVVDLRRLLERDTAEDRDVRRCGGPARHAKNEDDGRDPHPDGGDAAPSAQSIDHLLHSVRHPPPSISSAC